MSDPRETFKYWAFISYSHQDSRWCNWLHRGLERYHPPRRLVGKETRSGVVPKRIFPVFRDREELPTSSDLGDMLVQALRDSRYLIVVCSPTAAQSRWVNEEVMEFKRMGRSNRILCVIVDGEPNASDKAETRLQECFPEAIRHHLGADGRLTAERSEPIAADARPSGEGKRDALLKVVAGVLGLGFDELKRRDLARRQRRMAAVTVTSLILVAVMVALTVAAVLARNDAERRSIQMTRFAGEIIFEAELATQHVAGTAEVRRMLMRRALDYLDSLTEESDDPRIVEERGRGYIRAARSLGDPYEPNLGQYYKAQEAVERGIRLLESIQDSVSDQGSLRRALAAGYVVHGDILGVNEGAEAALRRHRDAEAIVTQLTASGDVDDELRTNHSRVKGRIGDALKLLNRLDEATQAYEASATIKLELLGATAGNVKPPAGGSGNESERTLRSDYATTLGTRAEILQSQGKIQKAQEFLDEAHGIHQDLLDTYPGHALYRRNIANISYRLGELWKAKGDPERAYDHHRRALEYRRNFFELEPQDNQALHAYWISVGELSTLEYQLKRPQYAIKGLKLYDSLSQRLAEQRPEVPDYPLLRIGAHLQIGQIQLELQDRSGSFQHFQTATDLAESFVTQFPSDWRGLRDLTKASVAVGLIHFAEQKPLAARETIRKAVTVGRQALQINPDDNVTRVALATALSMQAVISEIDLESAALSTQERRNRLMELKRAHLEALDLTAQVPPDLLKTPGANIQELIQQSLRSLQQQIDRLEP